MASTVTPATLTVTIDEDIFLHGVQCGGKNTHTITNIAEMSRRIMTLGTTEVTLLQLDNTANAAGTFIRSAVKWFRVTNLDDAINLVLLVSDADSPSEAFEVEVGPGESFLLGDALRFDTATSISGATLVNIRDINGAAASSTIDVEVIVAST